MLMVGSRFEIPNQLMGTPTPRIMLRLYSTAASRHLQTCLTCIDDVCRCQHGDLHCFSSRPMLLTCATCLADTCVDCCSGCRL